MKKKNKSTIEEVLALKAELFSAAIAFAVIERGARGAAPTWRPVDVTAAEERLKAAARAVEANGKKET
jgi:hypothetical protein